MIVMGYPVNIASRLQNATKDLNNNFIVSTEIYESLNPLEEAQYSEIKVKGIADKISAYLLRSPYK
jgi:adenylate cyclase